MKSIAVLSKVFFICVFLFGCGKDDELKKEKVIDNIKYQIEYFNNEQLLDNVKDTSYKMANLHYFRFAISEEKNSGRIKEIMKAANYNKLLSYVNERISKDFKLFSGAENAYPVLVHFEANYKLTNTLVFMVAFEKVKNENNVIIEYNDNIFNNGTIKFNYKLSS